MSDLISREDAREAIEKLMDIHFDRQVVLAKARDAIVWLPSADRPTGRWEVVDATEPRRYGCSKCKRLSWDMSNYCPNCGCAMMEGGEEE